MPGSSINFMKTPHTFTVIISDGVEAGGYKYQFELFDDNSIYELAQAIAQKFSVEVPKATFVEPTKLP
jgi:hypothetical protein